MQPLKARMVLFGALAGLACHGDPTGNEGTPTSIVAQPKVVFVSQGTAEPVLVTVVDEDGQSLQADFTVSDVGAGIAVEEDPTFLGVTSGNQIRRQARFFVTAVDLTATTFVVSALGLSETIQVTSIPASLAATISDTLPLLGDTISITAPAGTFFTESSVLSFEGAEPVVVSQDATTIVFIPFPNIAGPAVVSNVGVTSNPNLTFSLATTSRVKTDSIVDIGANLAPPAPALGDPVTLVLPPALRVIPESLAAVDGLGLQVAGSAITPLNVTVSPDSSTITFVPPPNADSFVVVPGVIARRLPMYPLQLSTTARVTTPVVETVPSSVSDAAPDVNEAVTLTSTDPAFTFAADAGVTVGAIGAVVTDVAANGSSITFVPAPAATGALTVTGVGLAGFSLTLLSSAPPITVSAVVPTLAGTGDPGTAPALAVPATGASTILYDTGTFDYQAPIFGGAFGLFPARLYEITVPAGDFTVTLEWSTGEDLGGYFFASDGTTEPAELGPADAHGEGTDASPETATNTFAAGTYLLAVVNFSATNPEFSIRIDAE